MNRDKTMIHHCWYIDVYIACLCVSVGNPYIFQIFIYLSLAILLL